MQFVLVQVGQSMRDLFVFTVVAVRFPEGYGGLLSLNPPKHLDILSLDLFYLLFAECGVQGPHMML